MNEYEKTRKEYVEDIKKNLLGPGVEMSVPDAEHEILSDMPSGVYQMGMLYPQQITNNDNEDVDYDDEYEVESEESENDDVLEEDNSDSSDDHKPSDNTNDDSKEDELNETVNMASQNLPSSVGYTFCVAEDINEITCHVKFATYEKIKPEECMARPSKTFTNISDSITQKLKKIVELKNGYYVFTKDTLNHATDKNAFNMYLQRELNDVFKVEGRRSESEELLRNNIYLLKNQSYRGFKRNPYETSITLTFGETNYIDGENNENYGKICGKNLKIIAIKRKYNNDYYITIMLVNTEKKVLDSDGKPKFDESTIIFQPELLISERDNTFKFKNYSVQGNLEYADEEEISLNLQYRNKKNYATGLGSSVMWNLDDEQNLELKNEYFPQVEVPGMDFSLPEDASLSPESLSMKYYSDFDETSKEEKLENLEAFVSLYEEWINKTKATDLSAYPEQYKTVAENNIAGCVKVKDRMLKGIQILSTNDNAWEAFNLANRAMYMQRTHIILQSKVGNRYLDDEEYGELLATFDEKKSTYKKLENLEFEGTKPFENVKFEWRPFQLAFLLMSIEGMTDDNCSDRDLVDLIWFPTGGGKTEAYLGLTAFTIFYRRLAHKQDCGGTNVIMRYTLRLLTSQQFTRASTLICACEKIRTSTKNEDGELRYGTEPITVGLWIGGEHVPNNIGSDTEENSVKGVISRLRGTTTVNTLNFKKGLNRFQVLKCPWCGTKLEPEVVDGTVKGDFGAYQVDENVFRIQCTQSSCTFGKKGSLNKLPIQIIDENLYDNPPTLLFGTVDKFAMLPWNQKSGKFFGIDHSGKTNNRAPELIIQDELHLISGSLGTMVGLFETAIDKMCQLKGVKPKIIGSTATIRHAKEQCRALYNREVNQFPHPAIDAEDTYFAREDKKKYGRLYVGMMAVKTKALTGSRAIAHLMNTIYAMPLSDEIKDKYWTLTVYFNTLRELGMFRSIVSDNVVDSLKNMKYKNPDLHSRKIGMPDELTSRVSTVQLNSTLDKLEHTQYSKENIENEVYASNILLATNMISVGIDISRLNVMLMIGQPKSTSEYIQASSRVGRNYPGVAFVMYDGARSRDRSHFEQFKAYHDAFYKYVEPTSVTPFSDPARDRALHSVLLALLRNMEKDLSGEDEAKNFNLTDYTATLNEIKTFICERNKSINEKINPHMTDNTKLLENEISQFFSNYWMQKISDANKENSTLVYGGGRNMFGLQEGHSRLMKLFNTYLEEPTKETMSSMRNVDAELTGKVLIF